MRQYKFRGKPLPGSGWGEGWIVGCLYYDESGVYIKPSEKGGRFGCGCPVIPETVGISLCLPDKNDIEIYEGDIVRMHQFLFDGTEVEHEHTGIVKYNDATASFHYTQITGKFYSEHTGHAEGEDTVGVPISTFYGLHEESFEIIGNIHDNPELINRTA